MNVVLGGAAVSGLHAVDHVTKLASTLLRGSVHSRFGFQLCSDYTIWFPRGPLPAVTPMLREAAIFLTANSYNQILPQPKGEEQTEDRRLN